MALHTQIHASLFRSYSRIGRVPFCSFSSIQSKEQQSTQQSVADHLVPNSGFDLFLSVGQNDSLVGQNVDTVRLLEPKMGSTGDSSVTAPNVDPEDVSIQQDEGECQEKTKDVCKRERERERENKDNKPTITDFESTRHSRLPVVPIVIVLQNLSVSRKGGTTTLYT